MVKINGIEEQTKESFRNAFECSTSLKSVILIARSIKMSSFGLNS